MSTAKTRHYTRQELEALVDRRFAHGMSIRFTRIDIVPSFCRPDEEPWGDMRMFYRAAGDPQTERSMTYGEWFATGEYYRKEGES